MNRAVETFRFCGLLLFAVRWREKCLGEVERVLHG